MRYHFYSTCVNWPRGKVDSLTKCVDDAITISRRTFLKHVCREELREIERSLGYSDHWKQGLTMPADWAVSYHRSKYLGKRVYYFDWSCIEYVFIGGESEHRN